MKSKILLELQKIANPSIKDELTKMALNAMDRRTLSKEIQKAQKDLSIARKEYQEASAILADAQSRSDAAGQSLKNNSQRLVQLNQLSRDMDLSGADSITPLGQDVAYIIDGRRMHVDTSDVNDVKITPWKEYLKSKEQEYQEENHELDLDDLVNAGFDFQKEAKMERKIVVKTNKKFR